MSLNVWLFLLCVGATFVAAACGPGYALLALLNLEAVLIARTAYLEFVRRETSE